MEIIGKEATPIEGTSCISEVGTCRQQWEETRYVFGIKLKPKEVPGGCSKMLNKSPENCAGCTAC